MDIDDPEIMDPVPQSVLIECLRLQSRYEFIRASIRASLERGAQVERGDVTAKLVTSTRQTPNWKSVVEGVIGKDKMREIIASTPPTEVTSLKIDVKKQALIKKADLT